MAKREPMWRRYARFFGPDVEADVDDELADHLARLEDELRAKGVGEAEIAAAVRARFGDPDAVRARLRRSDELRRRHRLRLDAFGSFGQDVGYALRRLRQRPGFTAAVVVVLALGVGATTAMFSAVDAAMLRPLPFPQADRLVSADLDVPMDNSAFHMPPPKYHTPNINDLDSSPGIFAHSAAYAAGGLNLADPREPLRVQVGVVTSGFFATMGVEPATGRPFSTTEGKPGGALVAILSHALWRGHFGGRPMIDSTISLSGKLYTVIGVMPRGFDFPSGSQIWIPLSNPMTGATFAAFRNYIPSYTVARLADGATVAQASARVRAIWERALSTVPAADTGARMGFQRRVADLEANGFVQPFRTALVANGRAALLILLGATGLLLLIACANVTNLLLSQAAMRRHEIAMRAVLGATRGRVVRQLLTESVILATAGTSLGVVLARPALALVSAIMPKAIAGLAPPGLDARVLAFAAALALVTGIGFGVWPAFGISRAQLGEDMKASGGRGSTRGGAGRARRVLVGAEVALALVLLVGAGLTLRSFVRLVTVNSGVEAEHAATLELSFGADVTQQSRRIADFEAILARLRGAPGIEAAGLINNLPLGQEGNVAMWVGRKGVSPNQDPHPVMGAYLQATGGYFLAMGIPLLQGRTFTAADDSGAPQVAVIDRALADTLWPGENPVGRQFSFGFGSNLLTVIGVVGQVRLRALNEAPIASVYQSAYQVTPGSFTIVARGTLPPSAMLARLRDAVHAVDPAQAVYRVRMMDDVVSSSITPQRTDTLLISLFGALALVLTALGVYAVVSYSVAQRRRELGIRAALGASGGDLLSLVAREMVWVTLAGLVLGLAGAWAGARVLQSLLYGVGVHDVATFAVAPLALLVPAALATLIPARRAARTNPVEIIRDE